MSFSIIPATAWGRDITGAPTKSNPKQINELTIHYTGAPSVRVSKDNVAARIKQTERSHKARPDENMSTLGYNFLIDKYGRIWEGRGFGIRNGANGARKGKKSSNDTSYSVCLLNGVNDNEPKPEMIEAVRWLRLEIERRTGNEIVVRGHRDHIATSCPGESVYRHVKRGTFLQNPGDTAAPVAPAPAKAKCSDQILKSGSKGKCVKELQQALQQRKLYTLTIDGKFGPKTEKAVRTFQSKAKLTADGVVGPITWKALLS
jgi:N-acetyl-anhydromuramyl-L-alanine amidase AmpD